MQKHAADDENRPILHTLVINPKEANHFAVQSSSFKVYHTTDLEQDKTVGQLSRVITAKYTSKPLPIREKSKKQDLNADFLRWALKPSFTRYIKSIFKLDKIIYLDCDLFFYNKYQFLIDMLDKYSAALTPHWRNPYASYGREYRWNQMHGLYNAGYVGFGKSSDEILDWWAELCCVDCSMGNMENSYVDQKYLDAIPVYFENTHIIRHLGCNVADWNKNYLKRELVDNKVLINGQYEIVFIHYSPSTISSILDELDVNLVDYCREYHTTLSNIRQSLINRNLVSMISTSIENLV